MGEDQYNEEKVNFTYNVTDTAYIYYQIEMFTDVSMKLCYKAKLETNKKQKPNYQLTQFSIP